MKAFEFDHKHKSWDRYQAFHNVDWGLVEFETGEVMVKNYIEASDRMMYNKYGIQLVATTDSKCPQLYLDKECTEYCKKAWITHHGMQELAIDWEQKVAVLLSGRYDVGIPREDTLSPYLGSHCHSALAYWSGSERLPIPLGQIKVQTPNPEYKKVLSPIILNEVLPAITAIYKMQDDKPHWGAEGKYIAKEEWLANDSSVEEIVADICSEKDEWQLTRDLAQIATSGFEYPRSTQLVDFLYVKGEK